MAVEFPFAFAERQNPAAAKFRRSGDKRIATALGNRVREERDTQPNGTHARKRLAVSSRDMTAGPATRARQALYGNSSVTMSCSMLLRVTQASGLHAAT